VARAKKEQVEEHLVANTKLELPEEFSARQTNRAVARRGIELQPRGVPASDIEARIDELRTSATEQVARDLRLDFILDKVAETLEVEVTDEEVNTEIARIARLYNRRFDRVRDDLQSRGLLAQFVQGIRQSKCIQRLLDKAKIVEPGSEAEGAAEAEAGAAAEREAAPKKKPAARKTSKKKATKEEAPEEKKEAKEAQDESDNA